jgi:hypothetical protein
MFSRSGEVICILICESFLDDTRNSFLTEQQIRQSYTGLIWSFSVTNFEVFGLALHKYSEQDSKIDSAVKTKEMPRRRIYCPCA